MMMTVKTVPLSVGDRFASVTSRSYREDGQRREHRLTLLCEVTSTDAIGFRWLTVKVLSESDPPTDFAPFVPERGETAWFGWDAACARGDVSKVA